MRTALKMIVLSSSRVNEDNMPAPKRFMYFIDGENLVFRYQSMLNEGYINHPYIPQGNIHYLAETFIWAQNIFVPWTSNSEVVRANYYTSVWGDSNKLDEVGDTIKAIPNSGPPGSATCLFPIIMKKSRRKEKGKGVDIQMVVDILSNVYQNTVDTVCIFSGDGDFAPVVDEVRHSGKRVYIGAFTSGLSRVLKQKADEVIPLDGFFFDLAKYSR